MSIVRDIVILLQSGRRTRRESDKERLVEKRERERKERKTTEVLEAVSGGKSLRS